jgi:hypothetical protein
VSTGRLLVLWREGFDVVYERASSTDAAFYLRASDIHQ